MDHIIHVTNLSKNYGKFTAVNDVSFDVTKGEIFGLLGENGAGKTTTLEMIEGLRKPSSGNISVLEFDTTKDLKSIKEKIGVQLQSSAYYAYLNLMEILQLFGSFYPKHANPKELLAMVGLESKAKSYVGKLSGGQRQRFSIVASLINDPEVVFLDEPTTGLDPLARRQLWDIISEIKKRGKTVMLTTHYLEEAEMLCDHIAIMDDGKIIAKDFTHKLIEKAKTPFKLNFIAPNIKPETINNLSKIAKPQELVGKPYHFEMHLKSSDDLNNAIAILQKINPESFIVGKASLEDVFIELTGKTLSGEERKDD